MDQVKFVCLSRPCHFNFFNGCLPQILVGPFLHTLTQLFIKFTLGNNNCKWSKTGMEKQCTCHSFSIKFTKVIGNFKNLFGKLGLFRGLVNKEKTFVVFWKNSSFVFLTSPRLKAYRLISSLYRDQVKKTLYLLEAMLLCMCDMNLINWLLPHSHRHN